MMAARAGAQTGGLGRHARCCVMPPAVIFLRSRLVAATAPIRGRVLSLVALAAVHFVALGILAWSEAEPVAIAALTVLSLAIPIDREDEFYRHQFVSKFARSSAVAIVDLLTRGVLEADVSTADRLDLSSPAACPPKEKLPHIMLVFDESSFDAT